MAFRIPSFARPGAVKGRLPQVVRHWMSWRRFMARRTRNYTDDHTKLFLTVQNKVIEGGV